MYHVRTKHIDVKFHNIRELVSSELLLEKVHTSKNAPDMLTKPVTMKKFKHVKGIFGISFIRVSINTLLCNPNLIHSENPLSLFL